MGIRDSGLSLSSWKARLESLITLQPCGERVLLTLCTHYSIYVVPVLLGMLQQVLSGLHWSLA